MSLDTPAKFSTAEEISKTLLRELLPQVNKPGQYLGNEWGARRKDFQQCRVRMALAFPDLYELGMSNFGLKILYQIINDLDGYMVDRTYAPAQDMEALLRKLDLPLFAFESRQPLRNFDLIGFSLQYELTYTNVLNMLDLAKLPVRARERESIFPLMFGGGPSAVNPEPMAPFLDFFMIGDGELALPATLSIVDKFKTNFSPLFALLNGEESRAFRLVLLCQMASGVEGIYAPALYKETESQPVKARDMQEIVEEAHRVLEGLKKRQLTVEQANSLQLLEGALSELSQEVIPARVLRQVAPLADSNQPVRNLVPYLALVHDREVLEVRRGCDRGCRFCQPGYTFLPVRERSTEELVELSKKALKNSGHEEYSMLSLCVSDYTSLTDSVRALNREHSDKRTSLSFPSQRADRMNLEIAEELKTVRKSGITLAPEAGTEKMRKVINKGLSHEQIINAIESAYASGWESVKLYFMCGLPFEDDDDLQGIIDILKEATNHCRHIKKNNPGKHRKDVSLTCTISNFVPKPFTPFQWFPQVAPEEFARKHQVLREKLRASGLRNVQLNVTGPQISLLEAVISRGDRKIGELIYQAYKNGAVFDAWDEHFKPALWHKCAEEMGFTLLSEAAKDRPVGSLQAYDVVHIGLHHWWLAREWEKAVKEIETPACTENLCHACGICTELETNHVLAAPSAIILKKNPFVKELNANKSDADSHPSLFFMAPQGRQAELDVVGSTEENDDDDDDNVSVIDITPPGNKRFRMVFHKTGDLRFVGHLDLQNLFIRAFRRAGIEMSYTQGFNPSPKLSLAAPLPLFQEGLRELADIEVNAANFDALGLMELLNCELPPEVQINECYEIQDQVNVAKKSLPSLVGKAIYKAVPEYDGIEDASSACSASEIAAKLEEACANLLKQETLFARVSPDQLEKNIDNKKPKDLRPLVHSITVHNDPNSPNNTSNLWIELLLSTGSNGHAKPNEVLDLISQEVTFRVTRLEMFTQSGESLVPNKNLELVRGSV